MKAAIEAVHIAEMMEAQNILYEAYAFTVDVIAMAATSLLVAELIPPGDLLASHAKRVVGRRRHSLKTWRCGAALQRVVWTRCL